LRIPVRLVPYRPHRNTWWTGVRESASTRYCRITTNRRHLYTDFLWTKRSRVRYLLAECTPT
jgi:hypothetical protein